jgi:hypothetical protein
MDAFFERLLLRTATIDELLAEDHQVPPGHTGNMDLATTRIAAWCRSSANGDAQLFRRRLERDGLTYEDIQARFGTVGYGADQPRPAWIDDAVWIDAALQSRSSGDTATAQQIEPRAFEHLLLPVVERAEILLVSAAGAPIYERFT